jgi:hypothetical protein
MTKFYFYKLTVDDGAAPCVQDGLLTLAICKPMIRSSADVGDYVFGFAANSLWADNRLIYVARVTKKLSNGEYWAATNFAQREDCVYEWRDEVMHLRPDARHHQHVSYMERDLGPGPFYSRANALMSEDFRYFGASGTDEYKAAFPLIRRAVERLGQGHRVWHDPELQDELEALRDWCWSLSDDKVLGPASSASTDAACIAETECEPAGSKAPTAKPLRPKAPASQKC